jgi:cysteine-rich repeat protein
MLTHINMAAGCSSECTVEEGFECNVFEIPWDKPGCTRTKCAYVCGDGIVLPEEFEQDTCDDGNTEVGDGCSDECTVECGFHCSLDGDDKSTCVTACGDGVQTEDEGCDDANERDGDGCSSSCTVESDWSCDASSSCQASVCIPTICSCLDFGDSCGQECPDCRGGFCNEEGKCQVCLRMISLKEYTLLS